jgi:hypothetical protein
VAFDAAQPQKPENRANIKIENNPNDGFNYFESVNIRLLALCAKEFVLVLSISKTRFCPFITAFIYLYLLQLI